MVLWEHPHLGLHLFRMKFLHLAWGTPLHQVFTKVLVSKIRGYYVHTHRSLLNPKHSLTQKWSSLSTPAMEVSFKKSSKFINQTHKWWVDMGLQFRLHHWSVSIKWLTLVRALKYLFFLNAAVHQADERRTNSWLHYTSFFIYLWQQSALKMINP